jgi:serine/threonine-protein kinase HipA
MTDRELEVRIDDQSVGSLKEYNDLWAFEYSPQWAVSADSFDLSPALPRAERLQRDGASNRRVQWYFDNLLPEEAMRTVLAKEAALSAEDAFGLLGYFGAESAGSLTLRDPSHPASMERGLKALPLAQLSERIANLPTASLTKDAPKKMSLAGAQHKLLVVLEGEELFEPLPGTPSTHILKPDHPGDDYVASVMNEYFTMRLARAVGLPVPAVKRLYVPQPVYIVERFDRVKVPNSTDVRRRHVIDTCQLLNKSRTFKYTAANLNTLQQAASACRSKAAARLQLYRWLMFNVLVGNADNHLKNISFLVDASGIEIAPAYDLLCTAVYDTRAMAGDKAQWPASPFAINLVEASRFDEVRRSDVVAAGRLLGLSQATATRELDRLVNIIPIKTNELIGEIETHRDTHLAASSNPDAVRAFMAGETRMLDAVRHIVIAEVARRLRADQ